ncbi:MAG: hypothetical protein GEU98_27510 [Pseudonocardiaceae bacterium]|nr:hypothetical protein [Pseudonocardiaceae bacterium]
MPIRTSRGRAAVYRRLWGWPLRSPAHLIGVLVVVAAVLVTVGLLLPQLLGTDDQPGGNPTAPSYNYSAEQQRREARSQGDGTSDPTETRLSGPLRTPRPAPANPEALNVAKSWASAWVKHPRGTTNAQWLNGLRPYTTQEYLPVMSSIDPANIPATRVTGEPKAVNSYTSSVRVDVPTDGPVLRITVADTGQGWRVARYEQGS